MAPPASDSVSHSASSETRRKSLLQAMSTTNQLLVSAAGGSRLGHRKSSARPSIADRIRIRNRRETNPGLPEEEIEEAPPPRQVIFNEEIEKLRIKLEDLEKLTAENTEDEEDPLGEEQTKCWKKVAVRKEIPPNQRKPRMKRVWVLRKAPLNAEPQLPSPLDTAGPKFDKNGDMIPYSILGTVEEFYRMNYEKGRLQAAAYYETVGGFKSNIVRPSSSAQTSSGQSAPNGSPAREPPERPKSCISPRRTRLLNRRPKSASPYGDLWMNDHLPYWAPRSAFAFPGLPVGLNTRLPSSVLVSAVRPSTARSNGQASSRICG